MPAACSRWASQFNLLEMAGPGVTPKQGVGIYENDHTQGPACAIAAGAGTIYRNYFAPVNGQSGQSAANQIDCLAELGTALGNTGEKLWEMRNGYALASLDGLSEISQRLNSISESEIERIRSLLHISCRWILGHDQRLQTHRHPGLLLCPSSRLFELFPVSLGNLSRLVLRPLFRSDDLCGNLEFADNGKQPGLSDAAWRGSIWQPDGLDPGGHPTRSEALPGLEPGCGHRQLSDIEAGGPTACG